MARPFDSVDSPLQRQQPFAQYGGQATRESRIQLPKADGAGAGGSIPIEGMLSHAHVALLMKLLSHPALGPLIIRMLLGGHK
jgi:hypothetical protein